MINRENYLLFREHLRQLADVQQLDAQSLRVKSWRLKWVLRWADAVPLEKAPSIRPTLPRYLVEQKGQPGYYQRVCSDARVFFKWLHTRYPKRFSALDDAWIATVVSIKGSPHLAHEHQAVTLDMVRALIALPRGENDITIWRDQAAAVFLFLSGCRASAFVSLPLSCIDIAERRVVQDPSLGVRTKGKKGAVTHLLDIPDLLEFAQHWDTFIRARVPNGYWYTVINPVTLELRSEPPGQHRPQILRRGLARLFTAAGLTPMSPHKFRHGHAVYALTLARDMADLKAISQNLMHANISTTEGVYAIISNRDLRDRIAKLGKHQQGVDIATADVADLIQLLTAILAKLQGKS